MINREVFTFFLFFTFHTLSAQQTFQGVVIDKISKESVPYVHVFLTSGSGGTLTDLNGRFSLLGRLNKNDSLRFTSIGYKTKKLSISNFTNNPFTVELEEDRVLLPGITIRELSAKEFIRKCVIKIPDNYGSAATSTKAFYWKSVQHDETFTDFYEGYVRLNKSKIDYDSPLSNIRAAGNHIQLFDSLPDILSFDVITQASMFINPVNLDDWKYEYSYSSEQADGMFVVIEAEMIQNPFEQKTNSNRLKIFIESNRYAIVRVDFSYHWQNGKRYHWEDDILFAVSRLDGTVEYAKNVNQKYELSYLFIGTEFSFAKRLNPAILRQAFIRHELVIPAQNSLSEKPVVRWSDYLDATNSLGRKNPVSGQD